jgi:hypothetical protein
MPPNPNKKKLFKSVFREERTASANVFRKRDGIWNYKDYGCTESMSCFDFIMKVYNVDFATACNLALDFGSLTVPDYVLEPMLPEKIVRPVVGFCQRLISDQRSALHQAFLSLIPADHFKRWNVGSWELDGKINTAFVFQNIHKEFVNVKWMEYQPDGKRRKMISPKSFKDKPKEDYIEHFEFCLFGEHLLGEQKLTCIVESEKTAVIASYFYPHCAWLSTHGVSKFDESDAERTHLADGRPVVVLCDADPERKQPRAFTVLSRMGANVRVLDLYPSRTDKTDLADFIVEGLRPEILFPESNPSWVDKPKDAPKSEVKTLDLRPAINEENKIIKFWSIDKKVEIVPTLFIDFIAQENYRKIIGPDGKAKYVHIDGKFIDESNPLEIKDYVENYLRKGDFGLRPLDFFIDNPRYFRDEYLSSMKTVIPAMQRDTTTSSYVYYQNCVVKVSKEGIETIPYDQIEGLVWRSHVVKRDFVRQQHTGSVFEKFIKLTTGGNPVAFNSMKTILGFLLHIHKNSATNRAIILNDEVISEKAKGGSGKGIIFEAVGHIREMVLLDGKTHDMKSSFPFQLVKKSTQLVVFDDVEKTFNFNTLFSVITGGITVEYKNVSAVRYPVEESPNIGIATNYALAGNDDSNNRRRIEVELTSYFTEYHTPFDEFKHYLFSDWDKDEWARFDNFMAECLHFYFQNDGKCLPYPHKNLEYKKFIRETSTEFAEWIEDNPIPLNVAIKTSEILSRFLAEYPDQTKWMNVKRMTMFLEVQAGKQGCAFIALKHNGNRARMFVPINAAEKGDELIFDDPEKPPF